MAIQCYLSILLIHHIHPIQLRNHPIQLRNHRILPNLYNRRILILILNFFLMGRQLC